MYPIVLPAYTYFYTFAFLQLKDDLEHYLLNLSLCWYHCGHF